MAVLKCKMCGGELNYEKGSTVCECEYCGSKQTIPLLDNDKKIALYERANKLRFACEFDKAAGVYESIVVDFPDEAEAYWGLLLCKYGIEYVDDPKTCHKVPTCHRSSFDSVMDDSDFEMVMENSDANARQIYREQAKQIEEIRQSIIEISGKEEPYDIFICYKETADDGQRTIDSVIAQDVYTALSDKGYKVFFARITLEDKLGVEYEPYIFAALNSAKVMLAFGTTYDYFNAVWVKNEWSRFLKLMAVDKNKYLIPCFKDIDAYDIPKEFKYLQAQDMGKVGAIQDLLRGIEKLVGEVHTNKLRQSSDSSTVIRATRLLEEGDFDKAKEYFERALDEEPLDERASYGKILSTYRLKSIEELAQYNGTLYGNEMFDAGIKYVNLEVQTQISELRKSVLEVRKNELTENCKNLNNDYNRKKTEIEKLNLELKSLKEKNSDETIWGTKKIKMLHSVEKIPYYSNFTLGLCVLFGIFLGIPFLSALFSGRMNDSGLLVFLILFAILFAIIVPQFIRRRVTSNPDIGSEINRINQKLFEYKEKISQKEKEIEMKKGNMTKVYNAKRVVEDSITNVDTEISIIALVK